MIKVSVQVFNVTVLGRRIPIYIWHEKHREYWYDYNDYLNTTCID